MVAASFGDYAADVIADGPSGGWLSKLCAAALVVFGAWLTIAGPRLVDRVQSVIVGLLLVVFAVFIVGTLSQVDFALLAPSTYPGADDIVASVALTFFAFLGFAVISFAGDDLAEPRRELPVAMYTALAITTVLYVLVALCVFGTLPVDEVVAAGPRALAVAAEPTLGQAGYVMMTGAALLATASSVTAMLYASSGLTTELASSGTFPPAFGSGTRLGQARRAGDHGGADDRVRDRAQPRRARLGRQRGVAVGVRAGRHRRVPAAGRARRLDAADRGGGRDLRGRADVVRRRPVHVAAALVLVHGRARRARRRRRRGLDAATPRRRRVGAES